MTWPDFGAETLSDLQLTHNNSKHLQSTYCVAITVENMLNILGKQMLLLHQE